MSDTYYAAHRNRVLHASHAPYMRHRQLSIPGGTPRGPNGSKAASFDYDVSDEAAVFTTLMGKLLREFYVTFVWMLAGWLVTVSPLTDDFWAGPVAFGVSLYVILESLRGTSANPLVSLINLLFKSSQSSRAVYHWGCIAMQLAGALTAAYVVNAMTPNFVWTVVQPLPNVTDSQVLIMEAISAFGYAWLYLTVYRRSDEEDGAPLIEINSPELVLGVYWIISTAATNGSLHPWRQIAAAVVSGVWTKSWLYIAADFVGYIIACITFMVAFSQKS